MVWPKLGASANFILRRIGGLSNLQLRQGNGFKVLQALRDQASPSVRIVYTNHAQVPTYRQRCFEAGANYFFDKSLELDKVFEVIEERAGTARPRPQAARHPHH